MIKTVVFDSIFIAILAYLSSYYVLTSIKNKKILIINIAIWVIIFFCSLFLNLDYYIFFGSLSIVGFLSVVIFIMKFTNFSKRNGIVFWLLILATGISILGVIITKKFIFSSFSNEGEIGDLGNTGDPGFRFDKTMKYTDEIIPERLYKNNINFVDELLINIAEKNKRKIDRHEYVFKNLYLKNMIREYCYSKKTLDDIFLNISTSGGPEDDYLPVCKYDKYRYIRYCLNNNKPCASDYDCYDLTKSKKKEQNEEKIIEERYIKKQTEINNNVKIWILEILRNSSQDNKKLKEKLDLHPEFGKLKTKLNDNFDSTSENENELLFNKYFENLNKFHTENNYDLLKEDEKGTNYHRYNNELGWKFVQNYFLNSSYWVSNINKNYMEKNNKSNPICFIKAQIDDLLQDYKSTQCD